MIDLSHIDASLTSIVVTAVATLCLVCVTAYYAWQTAVIAKRTADAALAALDTADLALVSAVFAVRPVLVIADAPAADYMSLAALGVPSRSGMAVPARLAVTISNLGPGAAIDLAGRVAFGEGLEVAIPIQRAVLPAGQNERVEAVLTTLDVRRLAAIWSGSVTEVGAVDVLCSDAFGNQIRTNWSIDRVDDGSITLARRRVDYNMNPAFRDGGGLPNIDAWRESRRAAVKRE